jgi:alkanesulfonate monooxygenase SsuD/methylene tetrahydromethanopterin reductase-like flavin-dependent oxidoreductase (luciferase family)
MHVGTGIIFQNPHNARSDVEVYRSELALADLVEPLGFDSIWGVEHHFTDYAMCPDTLQFLTYMAGRTRTIGLGSMVVVLPWHDPIRVAEQVSVLDHMSGGRVILGIGRGLGRIEFGGFRVDMNESRERFVEYARTILKGLEDGSCEYEGKFLQQPRRQIRPQPFKTFRGRTYAAAVSPESARIMAELGVGILIIPQKPWETVAEELREYRAVYRQVNGSDAPPTVAAVWTYCDQDEGRAREMAARHLVAYWQSAQRHYELTSGHLANVKGYEYYGKMAERAKDAGASSSDDFFMNLQVWGTPEQCYRKILEIREKVGCDTYVGVFSYAAMPQGEAESNMRLFAREVMPELKKLGAPEQSVSAA